jgi:hypothetical protein
MTSKKCIIFILRVKTSELKHSIIVRIVIFNQTNQINCLHLAYIYILNDHAYSVCGLIATLTETPPLKGRSLCCLTISKQAEVSKGLS